jgi:hypothetical protein
MARKAPKTGDVVRSETLPTFGVGYILECEGIHVWVKFFVVATITPGSGPQYVRRDSVEVLSYAN